MAGKKDTEPAGAAFGALAEESWRLGRTPFGQSGAVAAMLSRRAEALEEAGRRVDEGGAGEGERAILEECLEAGDAVLARWRGERQALETEWGRRQAEALFLRTGERGAAGSGRLDVRG
jgi:hypothetical protein